MADESLTISSAPPPLKSMDYTLLREYGLKRVQELSGKIWTDDNAHDPGITILEMLAYAITDLGYRTNYHIRDILTTETPEDIRNFFQAKEIMPMYPVTFNDYRKLMIDVEVPGNIPFCDSVGVKNAWIEISGDNEIPFYLDRENNSLTYSRPSVNASPVVPHCLYNVLLEFGECEALGDLNSNTVDNKFTINEFVYGGPDEALNGTVLRFELEFPRWDTPGINWDDPNDIMKNINAVDLAFSLMPSQYSVETYGVYNSGVNQGKVWLSMNKNFVLYPAAGNQIAQIVNDKVLSYDPISATYSGLVLTYQTKVKTIFRILEQVKADLEAHRNLGEDFFRFNAIKIDQIALCADVEISNNADVEEVHAQIMYRIVQFLDPAIYFYSLSEMYAKGYTTDQIFDGPLLKHGFIDDTELKNNERRSVIHVSDLLSIIMDIPGVLAVRKIQIAGIPLDNDDSIPVETVRWCLQIPIEKNYVPRLSITDSKLLFFKENLPYRANADEAQRLLDELEANDRPQKLINPSFDIPIEEGEYKDIENYFSIQEEFPLVYGTSSAGLPATANAERRAQAKQLKGYLIFFEQLLADFLSQLFHVKDLFSMNDGTGTDGNPIINKTYFSQSLINLVPDALPLYVNPVGHAERLQAMVESETTFLERRNRVLNHLMARFAESFADYAMIEYKVEGAKAPFELIEDKLAFLNNYPAISSRRFNAFNHLDPCKLWHIDNISGLERRSSYLAGVDKPLASDLQFSSGFIITEAITPDEFYFEIQDGASNILLRSIGADINGFASVSDAKAALELVVVNGVNFEKFRFFDANNSPVPDPLNPPLSTVFPLHYDLVCGDQTLGRSFTAYMSGIAALTDAQALHIILTEEFYNNPESNRYNLSCFVEKYVTTPALPLLVVLPPPCTTKYTWTYMLRDGLTPPTDLLFGELSGTWNDTLPTSALEQALENKEQMLMEMLRRASDIRNYRYGVNGLMQEVFTVVDRCGDVVGTSAEEDFNFAVQQLLIQVKNEVSPFDEIVVTGSDGNDGIYHMNANPVMDTVNTRLLKLEMVEKIPSGIVGGYVRYDVNSGSPVVFIPSITDANKAERYFRVDKDLHRILKPGQKININGGANQGEFTVVKCVADGTDSLVHVKENIVSTLGGGVVEYTLLLSIYKIDRDPNPLVKDSFYVQPGMDEVAAQELADWIKAKFFSHEGMHVIEHVLLRPHYNEVGPSLPITTANGNVLKTNVPYGNATYLKGFTITSVDVANKKFIFSGNYAADLQPLQKIKVTGSPLNDGDYTVRFAVNSGGSTHVTIYEAVPDSGAGGLLQYSKTVPVNSVTPDTFIEITDALFVMPVNQDVYITGSHDGANDGKFHISSATAQPLNKWLIDFDTRVAIIKDSFLPIDLDNGCEICRYENPYSHIVTVVLPAWQGRFYNQDFRKFFEKLIRMECPAHIVLNICWIDCRQMHNLELHFKTWLQEQAKTSINKLNVSNALNLVIEDITNLRSLYKDGILHDCDTDPSGENAIVLNQTILGNLNVS